MKYKIFSLLNPIVVAILIFGIKLSFAQEPLTLDKSLDIAMKNSPNIKHSQLSLERSQQMLNARLASLKSQFILTLTPASYTHTRQFIGLFSSWYTSETKQSMGEFTIAQPIKWTDGTLALINSLSWRDSYSEYNDSQSKTFSNDLYLNYRQPLFTFNRTKLETRELELDLENTALNYAIQKLALEYQVTQSFFGVYQQKSSVDVSIDEYNNRTQSYNIIKNKVEAGLEAKEELYQAELDMTSSKSNVQNNQTNLENSLDAFKQLIGLSIYDDITVTADISHRPAEVDMQKALDTALKYRMELRQRLIDIENSQYSLIQASATNEFRGDLNLSYGIIGTNEKFANMYDVPTKNQRLSLEFNIPLFDWGERKSRIKAFEASVKNSELSLDDQKNDIIIEVRRTYRNLKNLVDQIEIANQNVRNAQLTYDINLERYKNGDITSMDLNLFQNQLSKAKIDKISALINYKLELLNMKVLSLYDFEKNRRVVTEEIK
jgi:outer membrane protein